MKKDPNIIKAVVGTREIIYVTGKDILPYIPEAILPNIEIAMSDQNLTWSPEIIQRCTLIFSSHGTYIIMLDHTPSRFDGKLLFSFHPDPKNEHTFDFPLKGKHLEMYTKRRF
tara:strand:+ start:8570 stop:8908 length:339 start_codon:yes stop_codon:yes gene_type:complete